MRSGSVVRVFDIVISSLYNPDLSIILVIAILIKLDSSGPIFYNSYRAGRDTGYSDSLSSGHESGADEW
jgi:lipopolysaccharide/colanic/teichoic acid biosynthesis glycosyltransferase